MSSPCAPSNPASPDASTPGGATVRHFIITRFNLRGMEDNASSAKMIDEAYLAQRLELFERFAHCAAAVTDRGDHLQFRPCGGEFGTKGLREQRLVFGDECGWIHSAHADRGKRMAARVPPAGRGAMVMTPCGP